jgi:hypothetical protein
MEIILRRVEECSYAWCNKSSAIARISPLWTVPVTSKFSGTNDPYVDGCLAPVWLGDDVIMEDSPRGCAAGWEFPTRRFPGCGFPTWGFLARRNAWWSSFKCPLLPSDFNQNWNGSRHFRKTPQYQIVRKSVRAVPSCYIRTDEQSGFNTLFAELCTRLKYIKLCTPQNYKGCKCVCTVVCVDMDLTEVTHNSARCRAV